ncbi:MAG: sugar ABC transporter ATP-binding protein [Ruminiclostridium sp.]
MNTDIKLELRGIEKVFPGVKALDNVSFSVKRGTIHVLCGENGAGKSTLVKIINGIYKPDAGSIFIDNKEVKINNPIEARENGISMIFQELNYIPEITIEQSMFLGREPLTKFGAIDWKEIRKRTLELMKKENLNYNPETKLKDLTVSDIQMLEILKAVSYDSDVIIMDEPTSAITNKEVKVLFDKIADLKAKGVSIIYISHKMDEIFKIGDEITVLRDGSVVETRLASEFDIDTVISLMVGRKIVNIYPKEEFPIGDTMLEVEGLSSGKTFRDISFKACAGEIVGFAGLMGSGRTEVARAIYGLDPFDAGKVKIKGKEVKVKGVHGIIVKGLVMLSEDRKRYGIVPVRSIKENVSLPNLHQFTKLGRLNYRNEIKAVKSICDRMCVKAPSLDTTIDSLSGGNQQKVVLSRWMLRNPDVLILDEPTRGIDVGAKFEIYKLISDLVREKKAVVMISSELPELLGMCDRIYVMAKGRIAGELTRDDFTQENVMKLATRSWNI